VTGFRKRLLHLPHGGFFCKAPKKLLFVAFFGIEPASSTLGLTIDSRRGSVFAVLIKSLLLLVHVQARVPRSFELIVFIFVVLVVSLSIAISIPVVRVPAAAVRVWITVALVWSGLGLS
jgi:hypothetical protein